MPQSVIDSDVPTKWERHGDLILFSDACFVDPSWSPHKPELWSVVGGVLGAKRLAIKSAIQTDGFRTPSVNLVLGASSIVQHIDNGVMYEFDICRNMFAAGNIREKLRVSKFDCKGETVVDLFAGIGYFSLQYLVHTGAAMLHACDWNPAAIIMLRRNLELNSVSARCHIYEGDCSRVTPRGIADRVNLGLIPSSAVGWPAVCNAISSHCQATAALRPDRGGWLHVHENVTSVSGGERVAWDAHGAMVAGQLHTLLGAAHGGAWTVAVRHVEPVKSYAPHIHHLV